MLVSYVDRSRTDDGATQRNALGALRRGQCDVAKQLLAVLSYGHAQR